MKKKKRKKEKTKEEGAELLELVEEIGLIGIGLALLTKEKSSDMSESLVSLATASRAEGKKVERRLEEMAERGRKEVSSVIKKEVSAALKDMNVVTKSDLKKWERRIKAKAKK
jgi:polyhydroxyalkanoate synthesis regulator phasin